MTIGDGRPPFSHLLMDFARGLSARSTCRRLHVGCVVSSTDHRQVFSVGYNGNATGLPNDCDLLGPEAAGKCGCFVGNTVVSARGVRAVSRRFYQGKVVRVATASGACLEVTPNHPILTAARGWVAAERLAVGEHVLQPARGQRVGGVNLDDQNDVTLEQVFESSLFTGLRVRLPGTAHDFHGDGTANEGVDVVLADGRLRANQEPGAREELADLRFAEAHAALGGGSFPGALLQANLAHWVAPLGVSQAQGLPHVARLHAGIEQTAAHYYARESLGDAGEVPRDQVGRGREHRLSLVPAEVLGDFAKDPALAQAILHGGVGDPQAAGDAEDGFPSLVAPDKVVDIEFYSWSGHVFNLQTIANWYVAGGIIAHNCLHAEENAVINCVAPRAEPKFVFCTNQPCVACAKRLINLGGVKRVYFDEPYRLADSLAVFDLAGIECVKLVRA